MCKGGLARFEREGAERSWQIVGLGGSGTGMPKSSGPGEVGGGVKNSILLGCIIVGWGVWGEGRGNMEVEVGKPRY